LLASFVVVFREALEAGLIVGIVLAATQGVARRGAWIAGGMAAGLAGAALLAAFAGALSDAFEGAGQEIFTASVLAIAVVMLGWHVTWMSAHARELAAQMRAVGQDVKLGHRSLAALAIVVGVAVLREGAEVVLFLIGIAAGGGQSSAAMAAGGAAGLVLAAAASFALYRGLTAIPLHRLFGVTNGLIMVLAAGMAGQSAATLHAADLIPGWGEHVWNTSFLVADGGIAGRTLHALTGYTAQPCGVQLAAWFGTFALLIILSRFVGQPRVAPRVLRAAAPAAALLVGVLAALPAQAGEPIALTFKQHRFYPDHISVPAGERFKLIIQNADDSADEFESADLNREKLVAAGGHATLFLGPLNAGTYRFFGDFHQDTAQGVIEAK
jgi:high-affinity iron transporter